MAAWCHAPSASVFVDDPIRSRPHHLGDCPLERLVKVMASVFHELSKPSSTARLSLRFLMKHTTHVALILMFLSWFSILCGCCETVMRAAGRD